MLADLDLGGTFYRNAKPMQPFGATEAAQSAPVVQFNLNGPPAGAAGSTPPTLPATPAAPAPSPLRAALVQPAGARASLALIALRWRASGALPARAAADLPAADRPGGRRRARAVGARPQADLTAKLADLETKTGRQLVVVTLPDLQGYDIEDYGYQLGRAWGIGQKGQNNGVMFIVAPSEHKVRIEVGYGLEPVLTDALSSVILQEQVLPKFRTGDIEGGVVAGTNAIITQLSARPGHGPGQRRSRPTQASAAAARRSRSAAIFGLIILFFVVLGHLPRRAAAAAWAGCCR